MQLNAEDGGNRQFIMVQLPEVTDEKSEACKAGYANICEIGKERIRRAGAKIKEQNSEVDTGFKVLKLDSSNLAKWDDTPIRKQRYGRFIYPYGFYGWKQLKRPRWLGCCFEVMLKSVFRSHTASMRITVGSRKVYSIGDDGLVLICFR